MKLYAWILTCIMAFGTMIPLRAADFVAKPTVRSLVYDRNQEGSKFYRIPAIVTAADGSLVTVADRRIDDNSDLPGRIDVVCRRSTDQGRTWSPMVTVAAHNEAGGYGDPALVRDEHTGDLLCIMTHGQGLWEATDGDGARICTSRSTDNGLTWSAPEDITDQIFGAPGSDAPVIGTTTFATSGRAAQLRDGRLMFLMVVRPNEQPRWGPLYNNVAYSDDHGHTWTAVTTPVCTYGDEAKLVELPDGRVLASIRNRKKGHRIFAESTDRGLTWGPCTVNETLIEPGCNGDIINYRFAGKEYLLHTIPAHPDKRQQVSIMVSDDNGATWEKLVEVCPVGSAYSSITVLPDNSLGILTEEDCSEGGYRLWYTGFDVTAK